ncbi:MAG TPA: NAD(P)(+) transhydrogenase (Re/Si-specific) subunit beta [Pirellulales bacterium]|jgi:NAD(P) transhydrogenase subunit beta|nr:NAD(P)(+) transhydrogenase (Re/Si-specific) subunit beta [Pirellulales bacterium]
MQNVLIQALWALSEPAPQAALEPAAANWRELLIQAAYLTASVLFILGLKGLTAPDKARRGMQLAAIGMLVAVVGTLFHQQIITPIWIMTGLVLGSGIGAAISIWMPMTAIPQRTAISHACGALAATLVGIAHYHFMTVVLPAEQSAGAGTAASPLSAVEMGALGFEVMFGSLTITGSLMAFGKLQGLLPSAPITYRFQNGINIGLFVVTVCLFLYLVITPSTASSHAPVFYLMSLVGLVVGVLLVVPIGGADMPVVISLLNSYAGLASSAMGIALGNNVLIIAGALDGASGFLLSILMSKAMNRSFANVLFGAFGGSTEPSAAGAALAGQTVKSVSVEDAAVQLAYARNVIVIPGYGMAVAQAQHQVRELSELIEKRGGEVKFAIHPVAGRMPGHMNVLLAEANIAYDKLLDMDEINGEFPRADVALVIGANDVVNPAARNDPASPIHGMPILNADQAQSIIVLKRSMNPGFAGIENELFYNPKCSILFGDAKSSLTKLVAAVKLA